VLSGTARHERPARFRDVFASSEFRALYAASTLSWLGDFVARAAITALVFDITESVAASAAAFAISFAPWLLGGYLLVAMAERHTYRRVMIICDLARAVVMTVVAVTHLPLPAMLALLLCSALFTPPFDAARSATLPAILEGDRYVVGVAVHASTGPQIQVAGYFLGSSLAAVHPRLALLINAGTFAVSAVLIRFGLRAREPGLSQERRTGLLRETGDGFRLVFANPALRALVLLVFCGSLFAVVPEGLAAAWAANFPDSARGWTQGLIMAAVPLGWILGSLSVSRLVPPMYHRRLLRPLAVVTPLALVPSVLNPPVFVVAGLALISGFAIGALVPVANREFVMALPNAYRARAFGVVQGGLQLLQGAAVLLTGALALRVQLPLVVGLWSLGGVVLMLLLSLNWPSSRAFNEAGARAAAMNQPVSPAPADPAPQAPGLAASNGAKAADIPAPRSRHVPAHAAPVEGRRGLLAVMGAARRRNSQNQPGTMEQ